MNSVDIDAERELQEVTFSRQDRLPLEVEVLRLEELLGPPIKPKTTKPTRSRFHTMLLIDGGNSSHEIDFVRHKVGPGDLLVIPEGRVHAFAGERVIRGYMALFTTNFLQHCILMMRALAEPSEMILRGGVHVRLGKASLMPLRQAFAGLAEQTHSAPAQRFADEAIGSALSLLVFTAAGLPETTAAVAAQIPRDKLAARFLELLDTRFRVRHQAVSYAQELRVSLRTLDRHLIATHGQTARQLISARLVLEAKRMLTRRTIPIKNTALELGFSEPQNFTRFFRTQTGLSPQAFRESLEA